MIQEERASGESKGVIQLTVGQLSFFLLGFYLSDLYSRRWRKNNFLKKSPDDTKKEKDDQTMKNENKAR